MIKTPNDVPGFLHPAEGDRLQKEAAEWPGIGCIVEIGTYVGRSAAYLASGLKARNDGYRVVCVDHFMGSVEHQNNVEVTGDRLLGDFIRNMAALDLLNYVTPVPKYSHQAARRWTSPIRILFIDGCHDKANVLNDYLSWSPHVVPGGLIAFHDYDTIYEGIKDAVDEYVRPNIDYVDQVLSLILFKKRT